MTNGAPGKIAWITGAGKGIGRALALQLAAEGWTVAASARTQADLTSLELSGPAGRIHGFALDITDAARTAQIVAAIERDLGDIDLAVLNAGTHIPMSANDFASDTVRRLVETNLMGTVYGLEAVLDRLRQRRRGHVAVVASLAGYRGLPTSAAYGATKAALINMCEALKPELEPLGIRLTLVNPGFVKTPLTDKNDFEMPFLMDVDDAARAVVRGLHRERFEITFPWRFAMMMKLLRHLPDSLFFALTRRMIGR